MFLKFYDKFMPHSRDKLIEGHNCTGSSDEFSVVFLNLMVSFLLVAHLRLADIQREAELLQKMDHPNIAALVLNRADSFWNL